MNLFQRLMAAAAAFSTKAAVSAPVSAQSIGSYGLFVGNAGGNLTPRQCWQMYKAVGTYAKVVDIIADGVASLKPTVKIGGEIYDAHPIIDLLNSPGSNRDRRRFLKELAVQYLTTGTAYANLLGNVKSMPLEIDVLASRHITVVEGEDGWPGIYHFNESRRSAMFTRDPSSVRDFRWLDDMYSEIVPIYDIDGDQKGVGLSRLQSIQDDVNLKLTGLQHNRSLLANGATLSGIAHIKGQLTPDQKADARRDMQSGLAGAANAGRILLTSGGDGLDWKQVSQTNKDMDWANLIRHVDDSIIARYGVPTTIYNNDSQTYDNYKESWRALYENAILPAFSVIMGGLARALSNRVGMVVEIEHDALSNSILADAATDRALKLAGGRLITPNEAREIVGYEPMAGGDAIWDLPGMIPQYEDVYTGEGLIDDEPQRALPAPQSQDQAGKALGAGGRPLLAVVS